MQCMQCVYTRALLTFIPDNPIPKQVPGVLRPYFDLEELKKVETTVGKVAAYLEKSTAGEWWRTWIEKAKEYTEPDVCEDLEGTSWQLHVFL